MGLSTDLISQFVKTTNDSRKTKVDTTLFGTTVAYGNSIYVKLDGSDVLTPISTTTDVHEGERVMVTIKNHTAIITGNISSPSVNLQTNIDNGDGTTVKLSDLGISIKNGILRVDKLEANSLTAESAIIKDLQTNKLSADSAVIKDLQANSLTADSAVIKNLQANSLTADSAIIKDLQANSLTADSAVIKELQTNSLTAESAVIKDLQANSLTADSAVIKDLQTNKLDVGVASATYATIETLVAGYATIGSLNATNANINAITAEKIFSESGIIKDLVMQDGVVTGELIGVTMKGDLIEAGTLVADRLIISGENGLYYELNTNGMAVTANQTEYNSLHGSVITAKSIAVDRLDVTDLNAFKATIAKFKIGDDAIYSGVKTSANDGTEGIYLGSDGQIAFGDSLNYLKYFKDTDDAHKLRIGFGKDGVYNIIEGTTNGLFLGNKASNNILIDTDSVDICDGEDVLARYAANKVELGKNNKKTTIDLCNGMARITNIGDITTKYGNRLKIDSQDSIDLEAGGEINLRTINYDLSSTNGSLAKLMLHSDDPWLTNSQVTSIVELRGSSLNAVNISDRDVVKSMQADLIINPFTTKLQHWHKQYYADSEGNTVKWEKTASITMSGCLGDTDNGNLTDVNNWYNEIDIEADKTIISGDLSVSGSCTIGKWNAHTSLLAYANTSIFGNCNVISGDLKISGSRDSSGHYWTGGGSAEIDCDLTIGGTLAIDDIGEYFKPGAIYGKKYDNHGSLLRGAVEVMVPQDEYGDLLIGRGVSSTFSTTDCTRIYGYDVYLYSRAAELSSEYGAEYRPYYRCDDSIELLWYGGGYISNSKKTVYFSIPLAKQVIGNPTVTIENINGLVVRQGGNFCYSTDNSDNYVLPSSYSVDLRGDGTSVRIKATMPNTTNAINNDVCAVTAYIRIKFS